MLVLAHQLLLSQGFSHEASTAERTVRLEPQYDTPATRRAIVEKRALARHCAGQFVSMSDFFDAANDS